MRKSKYRYLIWQSIQTNEWHLTVKSRTNGKIIMTTEGYKSKKSAEKVFDNLCVDFCFDSPPKEIEYAKVKQLTANG